MTCILRALVGYRMAVGAIALGLALGTSSANAQSGSQSKMSAKGADIMLMKPTALKSGDNQFEVMVNGADGKPIVDADVSILFVMPKSGSMAEMRNEVKLKPAGKGTYTGNGSVMMAGKWNVTVTAKQGGKAVGEKQLTLTAK